MTPAVRQILLSSGRRVFDFTQGVLPPGVTFSRASAGWFTDSTPALAQAAIDVPRFTYSLAGAALGLSAEEAQTNTIRNNSNTGAVVPSTFPNNWNSATLNGLTLTLLAVTTRNGVPITRYRLSGTPTSAGVDSVLNFEAATQIGATNGQTWFHALYFAITAGSTSNISALGMIARLRNSGGSNLGAGSAVSLLTATSALSRYSVVQTLANASVAFLQPGLNITNTDNTTPINITFEIGGVHLSQSSTVGSTILTTSAAVARSRDIVMVTDPRALTYPVWIVRGRTPTGGVANRSLLGKYTTNSNDAVYFYRDSSSQLRLRSNVGGVQQFNLNFGVVADDTDFALAARVVAGAYGGSLNGGAVVSGSTGSFPAVATFELGNVQGVGTWTSTIKSVEFRRNATDAELRALSA